MSHADDIVDGLVCMQCGIFLISDKGEACDCGHPVFCRKCAKENRPAPYFDEKSGEIYDWE